MADAPDDLALFSDPIKDWPEIVRRVRARTPARLLNGRAGAAYRTKTQLELRAAHAAARDAVRAELNLERDLGAKFVERWKLFQFPQAQSKDEYLLRPELGRCFTAEARAELLRCVARDQDLIVAIGDGLSVAAVSRQVPPLLELLYDHAKERRWKIGSPFAIRHCRVGILNEIGSLSLRKSLSFHRRASGIGDGGSLAGVLAFRPHPATPTRNLISNIHSRGSRERDAAQSGRKLCGKMMQTGKSGYLLREELQRGERTFMAAEDLRIGTIWAESLSPNGALSETRL
jgi:ethanolamine ammonia-lyase small subunit